MLKSNREFTKRKALMIVGTFVLLFLLLILLKWLSGSSQPDMSTPEGRIDYLRSFGWEVDVCSENEKAVTFPAQFGDVMNNYCRLQRSQGFDLEKYSGKECRQYTYRLLNYDSKEKDVFITIYVYKNAVIAGDIHTLSSDGFMHGFIKKNAL